MERLIEQEVYRWFDVFKNNNELTEIRLISNDGKTASGYFTDAKTMIDAIRPYTENYNIYFTLNSIDEDCYGRPQRDQIIQRPKNTTTDNEIIGRDWVFIDIDSRRVSGSNASDEQLEYAKQKARDVFKFLTDNGFYKPIVAESGNGMHLYLKCALKPNETNNNIVKRFTQAIGMLFSDDKVDIDQKVFNLGRISRLPGTFSCKGSKRDATRPQRLCRILFMPSEVKNNDIEYFKKVADLYPQEEKPTKENNYRVEKFDLQSFIERHNIKTKGIERVDDGTKYILEQCPFNENHKGKDAVLFQRDSGEIAFHCFHNSCSEYKWKDVRLLYEPNAYDKKTFAEFAHKHRYYGNINRQQVDVNKMDGQVETEEKGKIWLSMKDIKYVDLTSFSAIPTGFVELDKKIMGLLLGDLTILSGLSGAGKTSWLDCLLLNAVQRGYKAAVWSGELQDFRFKGWIDQIAAGKQYVKKKIGYENLYYAPKNVSDKIAEWLDGKLYLRNNNYGNKWGELFADIRKVVEENGVQLVCIDNLMALNITDYDGDSNTQQTNFINDLKNYAKEKNVHIILVCHPRKEGQFLRAESISGSGNIRNICDNMFLLHRVGKDFQIRASEFLGAENVANYMHFSTVVEVAKNRFVGVQDYLVGFYYEQESRRLKNTMSESIIYDWCAEPIHQTMDYQSNYPSYNTFQMHQGSFDSLQSTGNIVDTDDSDNPFSDNYIPATDIECPF